MAKGRNRPEEEALSPRQRQSQKIMRDKAAQRKRHYLKRRLQWVGGTLGVLVVATTTLWSWRVGVVGGGIERGLRAISDQLYGATNDAGYSLQALYLEGRNRTALADINHALGVKKGDPILRLPLEEMRARLEKIESIKSAAIERVLPGTLHVRVVEREPVALWQHQGKILLVDDNGVVMSGVDATPYKDLPLIVGEGAPQHMESLQQLLNAQPDLSRRFVAAVWVGERRWNIHLRPAETLGDTAENIEIRLPEAEPLAAWQQLADLQKKDQVLDRDVKVIDLRIAGRLFIKLPPENLRSGKPSHAKET